MLFMMVAGALSGEWRTIGDTASLPLTYVTAAGPALAIYFVFRATGTWPTWGAALALGVTAGVLGVVQNSLDNAAHHFITMPLFPGTAPFDESPGVTVRVVFLYFALNCLNAAVFWLMASLEQAREQGRRAAQAGVEAAEARAAALDAELRALRLQLDPHFMFNALNAVAGLIGTGRSEQAEQMVIKLTEFLRGVLGGAAPKVSLSDELSAANDYLEVEEVRFPGRIAFEVDCSDPLLAALVPDFILQPLIENSVKYGLASGRPVRIQVIAREEDGELRLTIQDDGGGEAGNAAGFGLGQSTTEKRLASLYGAAASLEASRTDQGYRVALRLPLEFEATERDDPNPKP